jgi:hypothetical protein
MINIAITIFIYLFSILNLNASDKNYLKYYYYDYQYNSCDDNEEDDENIKCIKGVRLYNGENNLTSLLSYYFFRYIYKYEDCPVSINQQKEKICVNGSFYINHNDALKEYINDEIIINSRDLGWDIKAKENKQECKEIKEIDRISCLVLNVIKICEKNPKLNYCIYESTPNNLYSKKRYKNLDKGLVKNYDLFSRDILECYVRQESVEYLSQNNNNFYFYKHIVVDCSNYWRLFFQLRKIGDQYEIVDLDYFSNMNQG